MFLTKYNPNRQFSSLFDSEFFPTITKDFDGEKGESFRQPLTNVSESDKEFVLTMEMPGVAKDDVNVALENDTIIVTAAKSEETDDKGLLRREIRSAKFRRSFTLGRAIDREGIKARLENGILFVSLPKLAEAAGRKINID